MPADTAPNDRKTQRLGSGRGDIARAARLLEGGGLVAFPTETVYGLGADATNPEAIASLYAAKGQPRFNPLIAHVASIEAAFALGVFAPAACRLAQAFWPGALTLVVPAAADCAVTELARAGLPSLAIRVPDHPIAQALLATARRPIAAPSANRSGHVSPTEAAHVLADLDGLIDAVIDGGSTAIGVESTIIACLDDAVLMLRPGGLPRGAIEAVLGRPLAERTGDAAAPLAPGRLASHYAPRLPLRLDVSRVAPGEACLGFGSPLPPGADPAFARNLSIRGDLVEAAANLYRHLRALDALDRTGIAVAPIPQAGFGEAIRDRLSRAAAPRAKGENDPRIPAKDTFAS